MNYIRLKPQKITDLIQDNDFAIGLQLSRLLNVINSNHRHYLRIPNDKNPANIRDRIELILYNGAIVYETIKTTIKHSKRLSKLQTWSSKNEIIKSIQHDFSDKNSFIVKCLKIIRNKIIFHYELAPIKNMLISFPFDNNTNFAEAQSNRKIDLAYTLSDEILLNFILTQIDDNKSETERWAYIQEELIGLSNKLADFLQDLLLDLLGNYLQIVEKDAE